MRSGGHRPSVWHSDAWSTLEVVGRERCFCCYYPVNTTGRTDGFARQHMPEDPDRRLPAETVFELLADPECRALLAATADAPRTASELSARCDVPTSTVYRKIGALTDAELVAERIRIRTSGNHVSEYALRVEAVRVDLTGAEPPAVGCATDAHTDRRSTRDSDAETSGGLTTDGGTTSSDDIE